MKRYKVIVIYTGLLYWKPEVMYIYRSKNAYCYRPDEVDLRWYNVEKHKLKREVTNTAKLVGDL